MLDYLIALLEDTQDFSWDAAKASHAVLLCRMEQGEIESFQQVDKIDRIRRANAQRHVANIPVSTSSKPKNKTVTCQYYNRGSCTHAKHHETRGVWYRHICNTCFNILGKIFSHPEVECRNRKQDRSKNE